MFPVYSYLVRIASLSPAVTEILCAFELHDSLVCVDQFSNYPPEVADVPHVKDHMNISPQQLLEYEPELVFTSTVIQKELRDRLTAQGFSVVHQDPRTINAIYESVRQLGMMLQCEDKAAEVVLGMQRGFKDIKRKAAQLPRRPRVYIEEWHDPPFASGNWVPEVAHIAGTEQFPVGAGELSAKVTLEQVREFDPDIVVLSYCGAGMHVDKELCTERGGWETLRAVLEGNVRVIDDAFLNRPGPRLIEGARRIYGWAFELLH